MHPLNDGRMEANITQAEAMERYAISHGIPVGMIIKEEKSITTVGQAYCVKRGVVVPNNWESFGVLTSDHHLERTRHIFDFIFGGDFNIDYLAVPTEYRNDREMKFMKKRFNLFD